LDVIDKALHEPFVVRIRTALTGGVLVFTPGFFSLVAGELDEPDFVEVPYRRLNAVSESLTDK
jgi:hypothetical protein